MTGCSDTAAAATQVPAAAVEGSKGKRLCLHAAAAAAVAACEANARHYVQHQLVRCRLDYDSRAGGRQICLEPRQSCTESPWQPLLTVVYGAAAFCSFVPRPRLLRSCLRHS
jgi:hypothetical protein